MSEQSRREHICVLCTLNHDYGKKLGKYSCHWFKYQLPATLVSIRLFDDNINRLLIDIDLSRVVFEKVRAALDAIILKW